MKDWVVSLTLVLADGTIVKTRNRPRKSSAGYDLTHLVIGSEGTLALVTEAVLRVTALPQNLQVGMVRFPSLQSGVDVAVNVLRSGHLLEAIELADAACMQAIKSSRLADGHGPIAAIPTLFVKFAGSQQNVEEQIEFFKQLCSRHNALRLEISAEKHRIESIWRVRKSLANALVRMKKEPNDLFLHTDAAVPISKVARLIARSEELVRGSAEGRDWLCASVAHVGDGKSDRSR
jgi:D-lactate dehydrogenase (cytochrome)